MAKKGRKQNYKKSSAGAAVAALCVIGLLLIFLAARGDGFTANIQEIWQNVINTSYGPQLNPQAEELADPENHKDDLMLYVLSTGNSDCMLLRTPDGHSMLVDAADNDDFRQIAATLHSLGVEKLDAVVATHPDADHIGSMGDVITEFQPSQAYMPNIGKDTASYWNMMDAVRENGIQETYVYASQEFSLGGARILVVSPPDGELTDVNDASVVLHITYGETKILLTGDAEKAALSEMISSYGRKLRADVMKVGHHGSYTSTSQELLDIVSPKIAFITCGENNDYGHPHENTVKLLKKNNIFTLRTDQNGDIAIFTDGETIEYATAA